jgi:predicted porin
LDAGIYGQKFGNGSSVTNVNSGTNGASRLRFVGVEDMGGGNKANFWLEMQPDFTNGTTSSAGLFNRGAWLGLSGSSWGEVRLGRQGTNSVSAVCDIDQQGCYTGFYGGGILFSGQAAPGAQGGAWMAANPTRGGVTQATGAVAAGATSTLAIGDAVKNVQASSTGAANQTNPNSWSQDSTRYVRAIRYSLPTLVQGLSVNGTYAYGQNLNAGGHAGDTKGVDANYVSGALKVTYAYQKANADDVGGATGELSTIGAIYNFGFMSLGAGVQNETATAGTANVGASALKFTKGSAYALTALFPMGAATPYVKLGERKFSGGTLGDVTTGKITNAGVRYALSPRTYVYGDYVTNGAVMLDTSKQSAIKSQTNFGVTHNF